MQIRTLAAASTMPLFASTAASFAQETVRDRQVMVSVAGTSVDVTVAQATEACGMHGAEIIATADMVAADPGSADAGATVTAAPPETTAEATSGTATDTTAAPTTGAGSTETAAGQVAEAQAGTTPLPA